MKKRIWELDVFRGICILGVIAVHFVYDLVDLYQLVQWEYPPLFAFVKNWGGVLFLILSGICVTLGSHSIRRGAIVFASGLVITGVTVGMYLTGMQDIGIIIYFGVLHCLGLCMVLWFLFKKLPWWALLIFGIAFTVLGFYLDQLPAVDAYWPMIFGVPWKGFASSDYFPLFPNFGFFLLGSALGKTLYRKKESLLPKVNEKNIFIRFFAGCGRHSLWLYLLHQPILSGIFYLILLLK